MLLGLFFMVCFVAVVIIAIGTSIIRGILNFIFGLFGHSGQSYGQNKQPHHSSHQSQTQSRQSTDSGEKKRDKIFDKSDGEYVDFEEIKE